MTLIHPSRPVNTMPKTETKNRLMPLAARWETALIAILIVICGLNTAASPYFLDLHNLFDSTQIFSEKGLLVLSMTLIVITGDIDLSIASIIALTGTIIGFMALHGVDTPWLVLGGIAVGTACGAFNGGVIVRFQVPAIVVTIGTMSLFRGISYIMLGDQAYTHFPESFAELGQGYLGGLVPWEFLIYLVMAAVFAVFLHRTVFGRDLFALGNNAQAARYSGIRVQNYRFLVFTLSGAMAGLAAVLFTSRVGAVRPNMAQGWELEVVATAVLGGVNIMGGSGSIPGVVLATFVFGMLSFGLGLINVPGIIMSIVTGALLIGAIATPIVVRRLRSRG
jgi:rhamnose transport system permease protein